MDRTGAESMLDSLVDALAVEGCFYGELTATLEREGAALVSMPAMAAEELLRVTSLKEAIVARIRAQSGVIEQAMTALASALDMTQGQGRISLSRLIDHLDGAPRVRLQAARHHVVTLSEQAATLNRANDRLLQRSLTYVTHYLTFLQSLLSASAGYRPSGDSPERSLSGRIVAVKG